MRLMNLTMSHPQLMYPNILKMSEDSYAAAEAWREGRDDMLRIVKVGEEKIDLHVSEPPEMLDASA